MEMKLMMTNWEGQDYDFTEEINRIGSNAGS